MKDAYSFDRDLDDAQARATDVMYDAYARIFDRLGLKLRAVAADTGAIGGDRAHEFQVLADTGEDAIAFCPSSDYAANVELAEAVAAASRSAPRRREPMREDADAGQEHLRGRRRSCWACRCDAR